VDLAMEQDIEHELEFQRYKLQHQIEQDLRLLESQQQKLKSKAETLLFELEDRKAELKLEQQEIQKLEIQHQDQEDELEKLDEQIKNLNKLMHGGTSELNEALRKRSQYGNRITSPAYLQSICSPYI
jgi:chromosome segregation ATPase